MNDATLSKKLTILSAILANETRTTERNELKAKIALLRHIELMNHCRQISIALLPEASQK